MISTISTYSITIVVLETLPKFMMIISAAAWNNEPCDAIIINGSSKEKRDVIEECF